MPRERLHDNKNQRKYERAIAVLIFEDSNGYARSKLPQLRGLTGVSYARDEDYDSLRKRFSILNGKGAYKIGLSLSIQPDSKNEKSSYFRRLQQKLFSDSIIFLSPVIYEKRETKLLVDDLIKGKIDIAELPPVASGEALSKGLVSLLSLIFNGSEHYESVIIKSINNNKIAGATDFLNKTISLGTSESASSTIYPLKYFFDHHNLKKSDFKIIENLSSDEIITSVATGESDIGAIAKFRIDDAKKRGHDYSEKIVMISGIIIRIPNGSYIASPYLSESPKKIKFLREEIQKASDGLIGKLDPSLIASADVDVQTMVDTYLWANPKDTRALKLFLISAFILVGCSIGFIFIYKTHE